MSNNTFNFGEIFKQSSGFGPRWGKNHNGIDYAAPTGTPIKSQSDGTVIYSGFGLRGSGYGGYGNVVHVKGNDGRTYLYAHNNANTVKKGDTVTKGQVIGKVGNTGSSTGPHLHFEIRDGNNAIDPSTITGFNNIPNASKTDVKGIGTSIFFSANKTILILIFLILAIIFFMKAFPSTDILLNAGTGLINPVKKLKMGAKIFGKK